MKTMPKKCVDAQKQEGSKAGNLNANKSGNSVPLPSTATAMRDLIFE
jgi:hypothetical protein